jgi:hypothetical protein
MEDERMSTSIGAKTLGTSKYIPSGMLTESVKGRTYELRIGTEGVPEPEKALETLKAGLEERFDTEVVYGEVIDSVMLVQITGSPFAWGAILLFLPQILTAIGIVVTLISVYLIVSAVPTWVYALGAIGAVLVFVLPSLAPKLLPKGAE